jgi:SEC-C motif-containing protein
MACCAQFHRGERAAPTPEALMRSRYAAFALGLGEYLVDTLSAEHADRAHPRSELVRAYGRARDKQRFMGLRIVDASESSDVGEVLFVARIFERGADRSFAELSQFVREAGGWRYADGTMVPRERLPASLDELTRASFLEAAGL